MSCEVGSRGESEEVGSVTAEANLSVILMKAGIGGSDAYLKVTTATSSLSASSAPFDTLLFEVPELDAGRSI